MAYQHGIVDVSLRNSQPLISLFLFYFSFTDFNSILGKVAHKVAFLQIHKHLSTHLDSPTQVDLSHHSKVDDLSFSQSESQETAGLNRHGEVVLMGVSSSDSDRVTVIGEDAG
ncbi:hypothetical protein OnM2_049067, partial [Erysiphe neolycopersici]